MMDARHASLGRRTVCLFFFPLLMKEEKAKPRVILIMYDCYISYNVFICMYVRL